MGGPTRSCLSALVLVAMISASPVQARCSKGEAKHLVAELYLGMSSHAQPIAEGDFTDFLDREVMARFPEGLTMLDAQGRWRNGAGRVTREASKLLILVLPGRKDDRAQVGAIASAYNARFDQQAVLITYEDRCVAFHTARP